MKLRFMSGNQYKVAEVQRILTDSEVEIVPVPAKIEELQTEDVERLVRDKVTKAFEVVGRPLFVEHTGLYLKGLNGLPAGLTQIFWDKLEAERFVSLVAGLGDNAVTAETMVGYCDGYKIHLFRGVVTGTVPPSPLGDRSFQWDCVFVPDGHSKTFAQMGTRKDDLSMRRMALTQLTAHLAKRV